MLSVSVQAGGQSSRMGENKALKPFLGRPLIERVVRRIESAADEILITTNEPGAFDYLGIRQESDLRPGVGPLGGLYTALAAARLPTVAAVACDMPFANAPLLVASAGILIKDDADVVIAKSPEGYEPLHAVYRRTTCLPAIEAALDSGQLRVISWFSRVRVRHLTDEELDRYDPERLAFLNVNTPEEFARAEAHARGDGRSI
jgi:molybdopterin-guanine dinucleotide biosynthesis protein A